MSLSAANKHFFYSELAKLLEAGFGIREAAGAMLDTRLPAAQAALLETVETGLASGRSIAQAFGENPAVSPLERSLIGAGERGGRLAPAFQHLADYFGMISSARGQMLRSLVYPVVVLHLGIVIGIVPAAMMRGTKAPVILGELLLTLAVAYLLAAALLLGVRALLRKAPGHPALDAWINRLPFLGKARKNLALARFAKVYHICLLAGLPMTETVRTATAASHSGVLLRAGRRLEETAQAGNPLGPAFSSTGAFPQAFARSYATAEESGTLDKDLERWSSLFQSQAAQAAQTLSVAVPKIFYALILLFVAWKIIGFYLGYYEMLDSIGE